MNGQEDFAGGTLSDFINKVVVLGDVRLHNETLHVIKHILKQLFLLNDFLFIIFDDNFLLDRNYGDYLFLSCS